MLIIAFSACQKPAKDEIMEHVQESKLRLKEVRKEKQTLFNKQFSSTSYFIEADIKLQSVCDLVSATYDTCRLTYKLSRIEKADFDLPKYFDSTVTAFKSTVDFDDSILRVIDAGPKKICVNGDCTLLLLNEKEIEGYLIYLDNKFYKLELMDRNTCMGWHPLAEFYHQYLFKLLHVDPERLTWSNSKI
jgi:hypothetical protein